MMDVMFLKKLHLNNAITIVGKGPSLEYLTAVYFAAGSPILCLNDSIRIVQDFELDNPLYSLQKDGTAEYMVRPEERVILLLQGTPGYSGEYFKSHKKRIVLDPVTELGFQHEETTAVEIAIAISKFMGCNFIHMLCCDLLTTKDGRTFDIRTHLSRLDADKSTIYSYAKPAVLKGLETIAHDFIIPEEILV
jgi:hypothetical protein